MSDPLDRALAGLAAEKRRIAMTDEMARRVGVPQEDGRRILAAEYAAAKQEGRPVCMCNVAREIHARWTS